MEFILASNNEKKLRELREILSAQGHRVISQKEAGLDFVVAETGNSFLANARLKAQAVVDATGQVAIADDSGLCVEALGGAPGVDSAIYGGPALTTDAQRTAYLLQNLEGRSDRRAYFVSTIVCAFPDGREIIAQGRVDGEILRETSGQGGFGYDPVFYLPELGKSFAQLTPEEKNQISHRGQALQGFKKQWEKLEQS